MAVTTISMDFKPLGGVPLNLESMAENFNQRGRLRRWPVWL